MYNITLLRKYFNTITVYEHYMWHRGGALDIHVCVKDEKRMYHSF